MLTLKTVTETKTETTHVMTTSVYHGSVYTGLVVVAEPDQSDKLRTCSLDTQQGRTTSGYQCKMYMQRHICIWCVCGAYSATANQWMQFDARCRRLRSTCSRVQQHMKLPTGTIVFCKKWRATPDQPTYREPSIERQVTEGTCCQEI